MVMFSFFGGLEAYEVVGFILDAFKEWQEDSLRCFDSLNNILDFGTEGLIVRGTGI